MVAVEIVGDVTSKPCPRLIIVILLIKFIAIFETTPKTDLERLQLELWLAHVAREEVELAWNGCQWKCRELMRLRRKWK